MSARIGGVRLMTKPSKTDQHAVQRQADITDVASASPLGLIALSLLAKWRGAGDRGVMFLADNDRRAERLGAVLHALDPGCGVMVLPPFDTLPYDGMEPSASVLCRRASVLRRLAEGSRPPLLIMTPEAVLPSVAGPDFWSNSAQKLRKGELLDRAKLEAFLAEVGYSRDERVEAPGSALFQGQTIEVFPAGALAPVRIELRDGVIARIAEYDRETLETTCELDEIVLDLVSEFTASRESAPDGEIVERHAGASTLFEFAPRADLVRDHGIDEKAARLIQQIAEAREGRFGPPSRAFTPARFIDETDWRAAVERKGSTILPAVIEGAIAIPVFIAEERSTRSLRGYLKEQAELGRSVVFTAANERDLRAMDRRAGGGSERNDSWHDAVSAAGRASLIVDLDKGFLLSSPRPTIVITASEILGSRAAHSDAFAPFVSSDRNTGEDLAPGDIVVHLERGVGILHGIETISASDMPDRDMLQLEFANQVRVLMPIEEIAQLWKYGSDVDEVTLDKADGSSWEKRRVDIEHALQETAAHLFELSKQRQNAFAQKIIPPAAEYERFASGFRFQTTADQGRAIEDVLADLASGRPMDRLVCGDVGYGKTEVALRAAAAAVFAGRQVVVAAPTTVLVRQHVETFRKRFSPFGVEVGQLSRFTKPLEARDVKKRLADGSLRIVIGTHAVASPGLTLSDLGLLIIDEEQRFGAAAKTKLAELGEGTHVLTLTATPIPRTLSLANIGLRELSVIATPPARRVPVKTIIGSLDEVDVANALRLERRRGGQSFFVCPRIEDIAPIEGRLREIVPTLALRVVHGRMPAQQIDETMIDFAAGGGDVLVTTNIIESGLDLPRANTIIVYRPDRFGLAQLHQLRGRVGRGSARAFAYFLTDGESESKAASEKRLKALRELSRSGAGFELSDRDLDLRGAGDLLGDKQAGHVKMIGPSLYRRLLARALAELQGVKTLESPSPELNLGAAMSLPRDYVADGATRLEIYSRIFKCATLAELDEVESEIEERFGPPPAEVRELFMAARISINCKRLGVTRIDAGPRAVALAFNTSRPDELEELARSCPKLERNSQRLIYACPSGDSNQSEAIAELLEMIFDRAASQSPMPINTSTTPNNGEATLRGHSGQ